MDAKEITDALATVKDSYFNKNIISLGYVKGMTLGNDTLRFSLRLPAPLMPNHDELAQKCHDALKDVADVKKVEIKKDWEVQRLPSLNAPNTPNSLRSVKNIIAIASGKGGVGKSTVTVCIAEGSPCSAISFTTFASCAVFTCVSPLAAPSIVCSCCFIPRRSTLSSVVSSPPSLASSAAGRPSATS